MKAVEIRLPTVTMRVADLGYLQGLLKEGIKCSAPYSNKDRLVFLGLAEWKELPPCPNKMKEWRQKVGKARMAIRHECTKAEPDWSKIQNVAYAACCAPPAKREVLVITKAGRRLVEKGLAMAQIKGACK